MIPQSFDPELKSFSEGRVGGDIILTSNLESLSVVFGLNLNLSELRTPASPITQSGSLSWRSRSLIYHFDFGVIMWQQPREVKA